MNFFERVKIGWEAFRRVGGIDLPDSGRSSNESLDSSLGVALARYSTVSPVVSFEILELLKKYAIFNPDVSQFCDNIINLANTGHTLQVEARTPAAAENALARLNETAARLYANAAGVDGLINAYLFQIAWSGAISSEDVVNFAGRRVEQVVLVPVEQIRFRWDPDAGVYRPYQRPAASIATNRDYTGLVPLHPETYRYFALQSIENSPYAKPPASAAVETIMESQAPILQNIQHIAQKFGLLGLYTAAVTPPPRKPQETDAEYQARAKNYLTAVTDALKSNVRNGLLVAFRDQKIEHANIADGAGGVYDLNRISEEQVMSGLGMQPAFFGRTDSTTETYADVVYSLLSAKVHNIQRVVKRRQEQTYRLDLRLGGADVDNVVVKFNRTFSRSEKDEATVEETRLRTVLEKVRSGLITPDQGAQELGYEAWADAELLSGVSPVGSVADTSASARYDFRFSRQAQRYEFIRPQIALQTDNDPAAGNVVPMVKKGSASLRKLTEGEIDEILERFIARYFSQVRRDADVAVRLGIERMRDFLRDHEFGDFVDADDFADRILDGMRAGFASGWASPAAVAAVRRTTRQIYEFYRLRDATPFGDKSPVRLALGGPDLRSMEFIGKLDHFYFSKFGGNTARDLRSFFVKRYFEDGAALFGRETSEELEDFRRAAGDKFKNLHDRQIKTIVQTSVARVRNWAHVGSLSQARIKLARIVATLDSRTTEICRDLNGKLVRVGVAQEAVERLSQLEPGDFAAEMYESKIGKAISKDPVGTIQPYIEKDGKTIGDDLVRMGRGFPPYHANCRTRMEGVIPGVSDE